MFDAETGIEGELRPAWLRIIGHEVAQARLTGVPVEGVCLYPVTDYPGWDDERRCPTGLYGYAEANGVRRLYRPLADELRLQRSSLGDWSPWSALGAPQPDRERS